MNKILILAILFLASCKKEEIPPTIPSQLNSEQQKFLGTWKQEYVKSWFVLKNGDTTGNPNNFYNMDSLGAPSFFLIIKENLGEKSVSISCYVPSEPSGTCGEETYYFLGNELRKEESDQHAFQSLTLRSINDSILIYDVSTQNKDAIGSVAKSFQTYIYKK
jgi:hypothetical protein